jgi:hypothetical protein
MAFSFKLNRYQLDKLRIAMRPVVAFTIVASGFLLLFALIAFLSSCTGIRLLSIVWPADSPTIHCACDPPHDPPDPAAGTLEGGRISGRARTRTLTFILSSLGEETEEADRDFRSAFCLMRFCGVGYSNIRTVRATSPAFIARNASLTSSSLPRRVIMSSRSRRPC